MMKSLGSKAADYLKKKIKIQSSARNDLWKHIEDRKNDAMEARRPFEQRWLLNLAFLAGRQYVFFNAAAHMIQNILPPIKGRVRMMDNQLLPRVKRQISDYIKSNPTMSVVPSTTEDADIQAAKAGSKFLKSFWQSNQMKKKLRQSAGWIYGTGNSFMDHRWNRYLGPIEINKETGIAEYLGDVDVGVWSPFEILVPFVNMGDIELHSFPWLIKMRWRSLDYIRSHYKDGYMVQEEKISGNLIDTAFLLGSTRGTQVRKFPGAMLIEYYHRPDYLFKNGKFAAAANGVILEENPYPFNKFNIEQFKDIEVPGQFWGKATVEDGVPLQKTWNQTLSDIVEFNRTMGRGKYLVPDGSNMRIEFDNATGQIIYYKPVMGHKPEIMTLKNIPTSFAQALDITYQSFNNLFSQHEVTQGTNKSDIRSGEMVALLREQDAYGSVPSFAITEESLEGLMQGVLKRAQKGYTSPRMVTIVGKDKELEVMAFSAATLRNNTDVSVKKQSSLPDSRIARNAEVMNRFERQLYGDPRDPEVRRHVMNMLDDAVVEDIYAGDRMDEAVARWENQMIAQGVTLNMNSYDNHVLHLQEHFNYQKKIDFQQVKITDPKSFHEIEAKFLAHIIQHQQAAAEQRQAMMKEQAALKGTA